MTIAVGAAPTFVLATPTLSPDGAVRGMATAQLSSDRLLAQLERSHAEPEAGPPAWWTAGGGSSPTQTREPCRSWPTSGPAPPVAALLASASGSGALRYDPGDGARLAGCAHPPGLSWGVIVERTEADALAGILASRETTFALMLLFAAAAGAAGVTAAAALTRPLLALAGAMAQLSADERAPLPTSSVAEIRSVSEALAEMQQRLTARTAEREQALAQLSEHERRFRLLAENAQDVIYRYRRGMSPGFDYLSPAVTAAVGYAPDAIVNDDALEQRMVHPDDWPVWRDAMQQTDRFDAPVTLRWVRPDGPVVWMELHNAAIRDATGAIVAVEGIAHDVTERRAAETALRNANRALLALIACNRAIARGDDEAEMLRQVCRTGGGSRRLPDRLDWLGRARGTRLVRAAAYAGPDEAPLRWPTVTGPDREQEAGPLAAALQSSIPCVVRDLASKRALPDWCGAARRQGIRAPWRCRCCTTANCWARWALSSATLGGFDDEEIEILAALASDVATLRASTSSYCS